LLALPEKHALARARRLRWRDLKGLPWVMVSRQAAPAFRQQFAELEKAHGLAGRIVQESDRVPAILTMVAAGSGVTMVPQGVRRLIGRGVVFRPLPVPRPVLRQTFAYRTKGVSVALGDFLTKLTELNERGRRVILTGGT
jgi:DNA-binding transcriptional LysR family regulator